MECGIHQADGKERILAEGKGESKDPACENLTGERRERRASGMAWGTCGGRVWERPQVRLENGFPQFVMDLGSQLKTLVVYFVRMMARTHRGLALICHVSGAVLST